MSSLPAIATVVGSGTMGPGIAATLARAGAEVRVYDISAEALAKAENTFKFASGVLDQLGSEKVEGGSVTFTTDIAEALSGSLFVIEAVPEKIELKKTVLGQIEALVGDDVIIATNTSGIPITAMAESMTVPGRFVGMHWANPPHLIPMIEVIPGEKTEPAITHQLVEM